MIRIIVVNVKYERPDYYCGRTSSSHYVRAKYGPDLPGLTGDLGNPSPINSSFIREEAIAQYKHRFEYLIARNGQVKQYVTNLLQYAHDDVLKLGCFCAPLPCHVQVIADWLTNYLRERG